MDSGPALCSYPITSGNQALLPVKVNILFTNKLVELYSGHGLWSIILINDGNRIIILVVMDAAAVIYYLQQVIQHGFQALLPRDGVIPASQIPEIEHIFIARVFLNKEPCIARAEVVVDLVRVPCFHVHGYLPAYPVNNSVGAEFIAFFTNGPEDLLLEHIIHLRVLPVVPGKSLVNGGACLFYGVCHYSDERVR